MNKGHHKPCVSRTAKLESTGHLDHCYPIKHAQKSIIQTTHLYSASLLPSEGQTGSEGLLLWLGDDTL